jgi:hypothetical protein
MRTTCFVLASVLTAATAHADKVGIVVTGEARLQPQLTSQLERWLHDRGHTVVPGALEPDAINTLVDCFVLEDLGCARGVVSARASANSVVYARVDQTTNADGTLEVSVTGYWFQKEHEAIAERRVCSACTDEKMFATVDELMHALVHEPPPPLPGGNAGDGTSATGDGAASPTDTGERSRMLPYGLVGAGALALVGGVVMIAIDEDPNPIGVQSPTYRDTATIGTVVGIAGAAALGVGLYLWITDKPSSQPIAAVSRDGAVVGWAGRF